jgi:hypothetical protein
LARLLPKTLSCGVAWLMKITRLPDGEAVLLAAGVSTFLSISAVCSTGESFSVPLVSRRERVVAWGDGIRVAPPTVFTLDADLAAAQVAHGILGCLLGLALGAMNATGAISAAFFHCRMVKKLRLLKGGSVPTFLVLGRCCTTSLPWTDDSERVVDSFISWSPPFPPTDCFTT